MSWPTPFQPFLIESGVKTRKSFFRRHSLSIVSSAVLMAWIVLYASSSPKTHWGAFFGNAIADWTGLVVTVLATKFMYEVGSAESREPPHRYFRPLREFVEEHSLSIFLVLTGAVWVTLFARSDPDSKWGQVAGNIVSEWTQIFGLLIMTKRLVEAHSKESRK
ncbi:MAG TPA: hypothetical protein VJS37_19305 [Terriglobales bacterium]|nr:hypothetical protein [Terriglobales bacterium]